MSAPEKVAFAKKWFARGECPGCGAPLAKVAGVGTAHFFDGSAVSNVGAGAYGSCSWSADDLTSLCLIATNFGRDLPSSSAGRGSPDLNEEGVPA